MSDTETMRAHQVGQALAAGLSRDQVIALVVARNAWQLLGAVDPTTISDDLLSALAHPAALTWDAIFVRRGRAELGIS